IPANEASAKPLRVVNSTVRKLAAPVVADADDTVLLQQVIDYYQQTLQHSPEALAYLQARGLTHPELIEHFKLGFANRTLGLRLPAMTRKAGAEVRTRLQHLGLLRASGHEHFNGSLVIPVIGISGLVQEIYGRKITPNLRPGTPLHLYLPGPHGGVFNEAGLIGQAEIILCEALIDALTFWCAGYRHVTSAFGVEGFTEELLQALITHGVQRVLIAYDNDAAGNAAAEKLSRKLMSHGIDAYRCQFPSGMDANAFALSMPSASEALAMVIRQAEWLGNGVAPARVLSAPMVTIRETDDLSLVAASLAVDALDESVAKESMAIVEKEINALEKKPDALPAYRVPPSVPVLAVEIDQKELRLTLGDREYTVRGIEKNLSYEQLKVWLRARRGNFVHVDTVELYQAKQRAAWAKQTAIELGLSEDAVKADLGSLLRAVEQRQDELIRQRLSPKDMPEQTPSWTPAQEDAALTWLRDPHLLDRISEDMAAIGVIGEQANALVGYLACVSRHLDKPLAVLIQSTSAAGKSTLMDALLSLMPEHERVQYSAMTGQSLFYLGEGDLKHKILAIAEEEGVRQAAYALKLLQSQGELTMASTGKDPVTGKLVTEEYRVEGPVMLFLTTTAIDIDEELLNRCLVLTINESREQTEAIHARQRSARTLNGLLGTQAAAQVRARHQAAHSVLRQVAVVNPYAEHLTFRSESTRMRRDHAKYLTLIEAIAFLHQHQRVLQTVTLGEKIIEYIEVSLDDIAWANRLAHEVLGRS
ncbi:MAG: toprim domain-containing protein, partial [Arenimonas sp.]